MVVSSDEGVVCIVWGCRYVTTLERVYLVGMILDDGLCDAGDSRWGPGNVRFIFADSIFLV